MKIKKEVVPIGKRLKKKVRYNHLSPKEWNNLAMTKKFESILTNYRNELDNRLPAAIPRPTPSKESAEAWKDSYFKKFPKADINGDGILSWYELKQHKGD